MSGRVVLQDQEQAAAVGNRNRTVLLGKHVLSGNQRLGSADEVAALVSQPRIEEVQVGWHRGAVPVVEALGAQNDHERQRNAVVVGSLKGCHHAIHVLRRNHVVHRRHHQDGSTPTNQSVVVATVIGSKGLGCAKEAIDVCELSPHAAVVRCDQRVGPKFNSRRRFRCGTSLKGWRQTAIHLGVVHDNPHRHVPHLEAEHGCEDAVGTANVLLVQPRKVVI
mmetsp:Transcript_11710/g.33751  ORF Transcript_11710/g.33751 Transcript_11710/m.33751 type:complete len:221 (+) Transcript_11710:773-1435(+)